MKKQVNLKHGLLLDCSEVESWRKCSPSPVVQFPLLHRICCAIGLCGRTPSTQLFYIAECIWSSIDQVGSLSGLELGKIHSKLIDRACSVSVIPLLLLVLPVQDPYRSGAADGACLYGLTELLHGKCLAMLALHPSPPPQTCKNGVSTSETGNPRIGPWLFDPSPPPSTSASP